MSNSQQYWQSVIKRVASLPHTGYLRAGDLAMLVTVDAESDRDLIKLLPGLAPEQRLAAIHLFDLLRVKMAGTALVACWLSGNDAETFKAGVALQSVKSRAAYKLLLKIIDTHDDAWRREQACYILAFTRDISLAEEFTRIFSDAGQLPAVRAQAAEGLANVLPSADKRTGVYKRAVRALLTGLRDPAVEVRFWACFALGNIKAKAAVEALQRLVASDNEICPTWWCVGDEAFDAICHIQNRPVPERKRIQ